MLDEDFEDETNLKSDIPGGAGPGAVVLKVVTDSGVAWFPVAMSGDITIGRSHNATICVEDGHLSRRHAVLSRDLQGNWHVADLGSRNGTTLRGLRLHPHERVHLGVGESFEVGSTILVLQPSAAGRAIRRTTLGYFEKSVERWCRRATEMGTSFGVIGLRLEAGARDTLEGCITSGLPEADLVSCVSPDDYRVLVRRLSDERGRAVRQRLEAIAMARGLSVAITVACFPTSGRTAAGLMSSLLRPADESAPPSEALSGVPPSLRAVVPRVAASHINVLVFGETGVGKEVLTETLHRLSPRAQQPLLRLNCAAISETLLESELFGYERGAFTGAMQAKPGLLETADGGTVFFDEIGEMPLSIQAKLLRIIEQREVLRLGGLKARAINVRIIAATHRNLEREITAGRFRQDLYFRLNGISLLIPPLRERVDEIDAIARSFVAEASRLSDDGRLRSLSPEVLELFKQYSWPGNIRELRNVVERAVVLCQDDVILPDHVPIDLFSDGPSIPGDVRITARTAPRPTDRGATSDEDERRRIIEALEACAGNQTHAARMLGISRRTLVSRLGQYQLPRPRKPPLA